MHSISISFGPGNVMWRLLFKTEDMAKAMWSRLNAAGEIPVVALADDFGQHCTLTRFSIHGAMFEDMEQSKLAHVETMLHGARTQAKAQSMAAADPALRVSRMGPPMIQPMGNGQFRSN